MESGIFLVVEFAELLILWLAVSIAFHAVRKLSKGDFKTVAIHVSLMMLFFTVPYTVWVLENLAIITVGDSSAIYFFMFLTTIFALLAALRFSGFINNHVFTEKPSLRKKIKKWIRRLFFRKRSRKKRRKK